MEAIQFNSDKPQLLVEELLRSMSGSLLGQQEILENCIVSLLCNAHVLMTGAPGLAKTTLVRLLGNHLGLSSKRIQFTVDLLPSDITGTEILDLDPVTGKRSIRFEKGPIFASLVLADEINRASPKTQGALLEAMEERRITVSGQTYDLPDVFMIFATQNPFETEGTFALPEAQLDRFLMHLLIDYPSAEDEARIYQFAGKIKGSLQTKGPALTREQLQAIQQSVRTMSVPEPIYEAVAQLVRATRPGDSNCPQDYQSLIKYGSGPRGGISLCEAAKGFAVLEGEAVVRWRHIRKAAIPVLRHRVRLLPQARIKGLDADGLIAAITDVIEKKASKLD